MGFKYCDCAQVFYKHIHRRECVYVSVHIVQCEYAKTDIYIRDILVYVQHKHID